MSVNNHLELYRSFTNEELAAERLELMAARKGGFTAQAVGSKTFSRDLSTITDQLQAVARVQNERRQTTGNIAVVDLSDLS